ncbi:AraC family transcriptional regulator [Cohnella ginsengisoli]|uniref:AraC family transcriptional regulator n=1 Tax=Cohnella ginsengisoli TaxID=425004 RepID=A0A9X4QMM5_9BACL|nr:AraC family transcriptional regulator [Cohnella ginsengisoli]MDG0791526.1 AraC family transcriptional regulator [Cohnella ginsengisoli]
MMNGRSRKRLLQMYLSNFHNKFYFITDGEGWLKIGDRELYPKPGRLALMPEGVLQSYPAIYDKPYTKYWCHFTAKMFKKHLGTTPIQYVKRKRIDSVKRLLTATDLALSEIGERTGIPDTSYLSKLFKSTTGLSPTHYKMLAGRQFD